MKHIDLQSFGKNKCLQNLVNEINLLKSDRIEISTKEGNFHKLFFSWFNRTKGEETALTLQLLLSTSFTVK